MLDWIFRWLLNAVYLTFFLLSAPWMIWRIIQGKSRRGWSQKFLGLVPRRDGDSKCLWIHAVSVGEVNLLAPVIDELARTDPDLAVVISTSTETGFELANKKYTNHLVFFCPYDFSWAIGNAIRRLKPTSIVLAELELWPNMIRMASSRGLPVVVINGRLSEKSFAGYQKFAWVTRPVFSRLDLVLAQTDQYADRFRELGCPAEKVKVSGSVKFDGVQTNPDNARTRGLAAEAGLSADDFVLVAGSTQVEEDLIAAEVFQKLSKQFTNLKLVLVPRHPERAAVLQKKLAEMGVESIRRTQLVEKRPAGSVLIVDVIGELGNWWGRADVGYVGGSMGPREGQNMIEPAAYGVPICFGPRTKNFRDVVDQLLQAEAAKIVTNSAELESFVVSCICSPEIARKTGESAQSVVRSNSGAAARTAGIIGNTGRN